ncbi:putative efflux protein, MATE family [Desulfocapsa sulfexigens DSM 10523]|uniref:Multidrug-efflux transporter n=1 Tax=Desulfocapsa sulfexigens (strain DSM 10523 / SB164P1) TaxID=1167006 RepID=M1PM64_DESSD|nr:MATE family efflux transporter [Desulfocapsa sulfexigens]AGF77521.1 putative efflux protein, MATE family [Desulfocapsa sulfexigens DSM 10523]
MFKQWQKWRKKSRYRAVSGVCVPLVTGMAATTVMEFTDRIFLSHYSVNALSAVVPAGVTAFLILCFLGGVAGYVSVFIAQYHGAGMPEKIGITLWQGIFFTLLSGVILLLIACFVSTPLFILVGHNPEIRVLEIQYFTILCQGGMLHVAIQALSGFFTGRGMTRPVMSANIIGMVVNIPLNYALINGIWGMPELGIRGAAIATVVSWGVVVLCLAPPIFSRYFILEFKLLETIALDRDIMGKLFKYGVPGALQFSLDIFAFTFFILIVGRMGIVPLAASNIVISISSLAFMPALGFSFGISSMTGQALGKGRPEEARAAAWSGIHLLMLYTMSLGVLFLCAPETIISFFMKKGTMGGSYEEILRVGSIILRFVTVYILLDVFYMIFAAVLKGAGDTRFLLLAISAATLSCMLIPLFVGITYWGMGIYAAWGCVVFFIGILCLLISWRYHNGKWEQMLVIRN